MADQSRWAGSSPSATRMRSAAPERHVVGRAHDSAVGGLHDGVPALEGHRRRQRAHPQPHVLDVVDGPHQPLVERAARPLDQRADLVAPCVDEHAGIREHRAMAYAVEPGDVAVDPGADRARGTGAQVGDRAHLLDHVGDDPSRGVGGGRGADVGDEVEDRRVLLVADRRDDRRAAGGDRADEALVGERQQVLDRAAAARRPR